MNFFFLLKKTNSSRLSKLKGQYEVFLSLGACKNINQMLESFGLDDFAKKILGFLLLAYIACEVSWNVATSLI